MPRPLLLFVDGESIRTPGLVAAMEGDGWTVQWLASAETQPFLERGTLPDLLVLDPGQAGAQAFAFAADLRARIPGLPVLVLVEAGSAPDHPMAPVPVQAYLERTQPDVQLAERFRQFRPVERKLTTDDLFGDLLQDLEHPVAPPDDPFGLFAAPPAKAPAPMAAAVAAQAPLSAVDIFGPVLEEVEAMSQVAPSSSLPLPPAAAPRATEAEPLPPAEPLGPSDFTLSGISGVNDPFAWSAAPMPPTPPAGNVRAAGPDPSQVVEEYGNYFLLEKIAVGGMAELFKAQQRGVQGFQKIVAIKRILPHFSDNEDFVTMFIDEAKLAAQLTHPNIVQIFDLGKAGTSYYIAMEYVNGRDLRTLLRKVREYGTPFPEQVAAFVAMKVAAALDYAHRKRGFDDRELKLVHRDISPQNILISTDGAVKLVDFGIAKAASKASHTVAGALKGKLLYMSPEQATGQPLDNRSDLYSLGLVLFELLTGVRCFQADSEMGVLEKVRLGRIQDLATLNPNLSRDMVGIVTRTLQKGVDHRYPSARFLERDLREYLQRQGASITEHDVAEYMNALLRGSREQLDALVSARFPIPASLTSGTHRATGAWSSELTASQHATTSRLDTDLGILPPAPEPGPAPSRPRWLLPVILALAVILIIMLIVAAWF